MEFEALDSVKIPKYIHVASLAHDIFGIDLVFFSREELQYALQSPSSIYYSSRYQQDPRRKNIEPLLERTEVLPERRKILQYHMCERLK
jgi:hypothetical protein